MGPLLTFRVAHATTDPARARAKARRLNREVWLRCQWIRLKRRVHGPALWGALLLVAVVYAAAVVWMLDVLERVAR